MKKLKGTLITNADFGFGNDNGLPDGPHKMGSVIELPETIALEWSIQGLFQLKSKKASEETQVESDKRKKDNSPVLPAEKVVKDGEGDGSVPRESQLGVK